MPPSAARGSVVKEIRIPKRAHATVGSRSDNIVVFRSTSISSGSSRRSKVLMIWAIPWRHPSIVTRFVNAPRTPLDDIGHDGFQTLVQSPFALQRRS
jgi:hypothetical protein